jgi:hypothetical protein
MREQHRHGALLGVLAVRPRVEWRSAPAFAEVAEALGIATAQVMAVRNPQAGQVLAFYTAADDATVWSCQLHRDVAGVLRPGSRAAHPGLWEDILAEMERES